MPTLTWYVRRLQRMSAAEIGWRSRNVVRDAGDRLRHALRLTPSLLDAGGREWPPLDSMPPLCPVAPGAWRNAAADSREAQWRRRLVAAADDLVAHRFTFLNLERRDLGDPIDWNRDHETGTAAPLRFAGAIDYRNPDEAGDAKLVWEPNRHLHLVILARAYRATGDGRYAATAVAHVLDWMRACPFGTGMNWRSPLELAIRAINWTWTLAYLAPAPELTADARARIQHGLDHLVLDVVRKYSRGSSANNHRIGEAAGVFVAASCVPGLTGAVRLRAESLAILEEEILKQTHEDGGNREQAFGYHLFVLQFLLVAAFVANRTGQALSAGFLARLRAAVDFADALLAAGPAPFYGDADDGYVLDLGGARDGRDVVAMGRAILDGPCASTVEPLEPVAWLFGEGPSGPRSRADLRSCGFPRTGLYLLQYGDPSSADCASLTFDCAELGFGAIAAHGHADALAVTLRAGGDDVLVDPGTYDYFRFPAWRDYFRSTRAHNTVVVDGADQSVMLGPFMWGQRAGARCLDWAADDRHARVVGEHDGYARLARPVRHRRTVTMDAVARVFEIVDTLDGEGEHDIELPFHLAPEVAADEANGTVTVTLPGSTVRLIVDQRLSVRLARGAEAPIDGWFSPGYHRKAPATTVRASVRSALPLSLRTRIEIEPAEARA